MKTVGIICEYNPFHNGHLRQFRLARQLAGEDSAIVCLMSGNYVQRGEPAIFPKSLRARAAVLSGADLVLELPLTTALSSAEGFAAGGVRILTDLGCDFLCFGTESPDLAPLQKTAAANLSPDFDRLLRQALDSGCSYPAARQRALEALGAGAGLASPNDILAVEYLKALQRQNSPMLPLSVPRPDTYHENTLNSEAPSATALRGALCRGGHWPPAILQTPSLSAQTPSPSGKNGPQGGMGGIEASTSPLWYAAVPEPLRPVYADAAPHTLSAGERSLLARLRTLPEDAFEALPYGSEGLWRRFMTACRTQPTVEAILEATKSKRYTRTRIQRMLLCAFLGLTAGDLSDPAPYVRILAFNHRGRRVLRDFRRTAGALAAASPDGKAAGCGEPAQPREEAQPDSPAPVEAAIGLPPQASAFSLINAGTRPENIAYYALETRAAALYGLFSLGDPESPGFEEELRVFYHKI